MRLRAHWPDVFRHTALGDYGWSDEVPRPLPLSRAEIARREEAVDWLVRWCPERDRRLVMLALGYKARGGRVPWRGLLARIGQDKPGADGLRMRYERAVGAIVKGLVASCSRR